MITFKRFISESGGATSKWGTERANKSDITAALKFVADTTGLPVDSLRSNLLGSTELTLLGKKSDSGDIDIAFEIDKTDLDGIHSLMMDAVNSEGVYNPGTKVASYAVPVNNKKVQVDFMFVNSADWAKFIYHSSQNDGSEYPGAVRNIIMFTALAHTQEKGKDFVIRDKDGNSFARASKSITMDSGMKRLFKMAKVGPSGKINKTLNTVTPDELEAGLKAQGHKVEFSKEVDLTNDPAVIVKYIFGKNAKVEDVKTAEGVIALIKKLPNAREILKACVSELTRLKLPVPPELTE